VTVERVLILYGGRSAEHEISIISARFIVSSLDPARYEPVLVGIDPEGIWHHQTDQQLPRSTDPREVTVDRSGPRAHVLPMPDARERAGTLHVTGSDPVPYDVVFPVMHGPYGEDGCTQGLLELCDVPYVGAGVTGSAVGMDKLIQKHVFERMELPVLPFRSFSRSEWDAEPDGCLERCRSLGYPMFVKPVNMGSSLGISRATGPDELREGLALAFELDNKVVVERGLDRPREIECSVLGHHEPRASLPGEINVRHEHGWYSYEAKYIDDGADLDVPAKLNEGQTAAVQLMAIRAFRALDLSGMARVDMFLSNGGELYLNEVNTIPGFTAISMYPRMWKASGVDAQELVSELLEVAKTRHAERRRLRTHR
jgi:D-alanine-D-alanine ligase